MSAIEQISLIAAERRQHPRFRLTTALTVCFGRSEGILVDISLRGARLRHLAAIQLRTRVRFSFEWQGERFNAAAHVLASRLVALGDRATFESRVEFRHLSGDAERLLARIVEETKKRELRKWVANLRGWQEERPREGAHPETAHAFLRCRYRGGRWERRWTLDGAQPGDGFTVPADLPESDLQQLCDTFEHADAEGRHVLRLMAAEAVTEAGQGRTAAR